LKKKRKTSDRTKKRRGKSYEKKSILVRKRGADIFSFVREKISALHFWDKRKEKGSKRKKRKGKREKEKPVSVRKRCKSSSVSVGFVTCAYTHIHK